MSTKIFQDVSQYLVLEERKMQGSRVQSKHDTRDEKNSFETSMSATHSLDICPRWLTKFPKSIRLASGSGDGNVAGPFETGPTVAAALGIVTEIPAVAIRRG